MSTKSFEIGDVVSFSGSHKDGKEAYAGIVVRVEPLVYINWYYLNSTGDILNENWHGGIGSITHILDYELTTSPFIVELSNSLKDSSFVQDTPLIRKIKQLDLKWEKQMKEKGRFFLTSRAPTVVQKTTEQSTPTDTATASVVAHTQNQPQERGSASFGNFMQEWALNPYQQRFLRTVRPYSPPYVNSTSTNTLRS